MLDDLPVAQHVDPVRVLDAGQPVGDQQYAAVPGVPADGAEQGVLCPGVQGGGGLVHDQQRGRPVEAARGGDPLPLAAGQLGPVLEMPVEQGVVAVRKLLDHRVRTGRLRRPGQRDRIGVAAHGDVVPDGQRPVGVILGDDGDLLPQWLLVDVRDRGLVPAHRAAVGPVQAGEDFRERGLARSVLAHQGDHLAPPDLDAHLAQGRLAGAGIGEGDGVRGDPVEVRRGGPGARRGYPPGRVGTEGQIVREVQAFLVALVNRVEQRVQGCLRGPDGQDRGTRGGERQRADGQQDPERRVYPRGGDAPRRLGGDPGQGLAAGRLHLGVPCVGGQAGHPGQHEVPQGEGAHLGGRMPLGHQVGQDPLPAVAVGQREVRDVPDPGRADRGPAAGQFGEQQQHQQDGLEHRHHQCRRDDPGDSGDAVEHVGHDLRSRVEAPVAGALHGVVELGVVEGGQLDLGRQVQQPDLDDAVHLRMEPRLSPARCGLQPGPDRPRPRRPG